MVKNKVKFYVGDFIWKGFTRQFIQAGFFDGKNYYHLKNKKEFLDIILNLNSTIFFYNLDDKIRVLLDWLKKENLKFEFSPFLSGDNKIIEWKIKNTIFRDSFILLNSSLEDLAKDFGIEKDFKNKSFKQKIIIFHKILREFWDFLGWDCFENRSISAIALKKFKQFDKIAYAQIVEYPIYPERFKFIKKAYFPAFYWTFKDSFESKTEKILKIDCNSFFGEMMRRNEFPFSYSIELTKKKDILEHFKKKELGIIEARVKVPPNLPLGFLMTKKKGLIDNPKKGTISGVWTSPELEFAKGLGYKILKLKRAIFWNDKRYLFKKYINHLARIKEKGKGVKKTIAKFLLVSFYGKFAQRREFSSFRKVEKPISGKMYLDRNLTLMEEKKYMRVPFSHPEISVFTTAWARIFMWKFCEMIKWENVYSLINDSLIIADNLSQKLKKRWFDQNKVGKFKIEGEIKKGIILGRGVYALKIKNGKEIIKAQGLLKDLKDTLTFYDFEKLKKSKNKNLVSYFKKVNFKTKNNLFLIKR
ncbi:MAG: hypothetical protein DDT21_02697 [Syntrophomonadaceae bacterium]|nr:hypothetical protein [Bacillota bacterium]